MSYLEFFLVAFCASLGWYGGSVVINNIVGHTNVYLGRRAQRKALQMVRRGIIARSAEARGEGQERPQPVNTFPVAGAN